MKLMKILAIILLIGNLLCVVLDIITWSSLLILIPLVLNIASVIALTIVLIKIKKRQIHD